jgi:hypothetical protein
MSIDHLFFPRSLTTIAKVPMTNREAAPARKPIREREERIPTPIRAAAAKPAPARNAAPARERAPSVAFVKCGCRISQCEGQRHLQEACKVVSDRIGSMTHRVQPRGPGIVTSPKPLARRRSPRSAVLAAKARRHFVARFRAPGRKQPHRLQTIANGSA